jgi:hypothetical protein
MPFTTVRLSRFGHARDTRHCPEFQLSPEVSYRRTALFQYVSHRRTPLLVGKSLHPLEQPLLNGVLHRDAIKSLLHNASGNTEFRKSISRFNRVRIMLFSLSLRQLPGTLALTDH